MSKTSFVAGAVLCAMLTGVVDVGAQVPQTPVQAGARVTGSGTAAGRATKANDEPLPGRRIRLRDVQTGRTVAVQVTDATGSFTFESLPPGSYIVEILGERDDNVAAASQLLTISGDQKLATIVKLPADKKAGGLFLSTAGLAVLAAAASLGVVAAVHSGEPASPRQ